MVETINKLIRTSRQMVQELGREPSSEELSQRLDMPVAKIEEIINTVPEYEPSAEERIASALEYQNLMSMDDMEV
jgi:DNA-directed RNA polymerase sigma subunit (sigma70/sigma32)